MMFTPAPAVPSCTGGTEVEEDGYKFCLGPQGKTYAEANQYCQDNHSTLAAPHRKEMSDAVIKHCGGPFCWIALTCSGDRTSCDTSYDNWNWEDGTGLGIHNLFMADDDDTIKGGTPGQFCASTAQSDSCGDHWSPKDCSDTLLNTLCLMSSPPPLTCDGGVVKEYNNYQFCYSDTK